MVAPTMRPLAEAGAASSTGRHRDALPGDLPPILPDRVLRDHVRALLPDAARLPDAVLARIGLRPTRQPAHGDLSTDAAMMAARFAGVPAEMFARQLAARLSGPFEVRVAGPGFINLTLSRDALDGILPALLAAPRRPSPPVTLELAAMRHADLDFMVQYAHARCRSVLRAAADMPEFAGHDPADPATVATGWFATEPARGLLCRLQHWNRLRDSLGQPGDARRITLFLRDVSAQFEQLWKASREHATLRLLYPGQRDRSLANLGLVLATADVIRAGLELLQVDAAEEIR